MGKKTDNQKRGNGTEGVTSRKRKKRRRSEDIISTVVLIAAVCVFVFALYQLVMTLVPYYYGGQEYDKVKKLAIVTENEDAEDAGEGFRVDFDALLEENPDTVAWLRFDEPAIISYPVVKSKDNEEYLTKTFSANDNKLGAIFMDKSNLTSFTDRNTLIYGHNLKVGGEMFSQLNEYADESFCREHPYFYIYTPDGKTRTYQVFSAGVVKDDAADYAMTFPTEADYLNWLETCRNSSNYAVDVELNVQSKVVTLSTCTNVNDDERFIVHGVLIEETE